MDVSIIFVNYKTKDLTIDAINSVIEKTEGIEYEIFVVDNASNDGSIEAIEKEFQNIHVIKSPINGGFGYANNLAIKQTRGKYILCLNTDTLLINNAIKIIFDFMEENANVGTCGGQLYNADMTHQASFGYFPTLYNLLIRYGFFRKKYINLQFQNVEKDVDSIIGADLFIRKLLIDKVGGFDENIFMYGEEVDLCYRIKKAGYKNIFYPNAKIIHLGSMSSDNEFAFLSTIRGIFYFANKHRIMSLLFLRIYFIIKYSIAFLIYQKRIYLNGIFYAFKINKTILEKGKDY